MQILLSSGNVSPSEALYHSSRLRGMERSNIALSKMAAPRDPYISLAARL